MYIAYDAVNGYLYGSIELDSADYDTLPQAFRGGHILCVEPDFNEELAANPEMLATMHFTRAMGDEPVLGEHLIGAPWKMPPNRSPQNVLGRMFEAGMRRPAPRNIGNAFDAQRAAERIANNLNVDWGAFRAALVGGER